MILACCALWLTACATRPPEPPVQRPPSSAEPKTADLSAYRLGVGDRVRIDVFGEGDLSLDATVDPTGRISYPLLGSVQALRKTAKDLEATLTKGLADGYLTNPDVRVTVVQYRPFYVIGQVQRAGAYAYVAGLIVEKALALAGGMTNLASARRIYISHEDSPREERINVRLDDIVLPGDTLIVEESLF